MKQVKEDFISIVVEEMKNTNLFSKSEIVDALVVLEQRLGEYEVFLEDLKRYADDLYVWVDKDKENYYELARIHVGFSQKYSYDIIINDKEEMIGYCMCEETDEDYNEKYKCCGKECDWYRPSFFIKKTKYIARRVDFEGQQRDYWKAQEKFIDKYFEEEEKIEQEKNEKRNQLLKDIAYYEQFIQNLQEQLKNLE